MVSRSMPFGVSNHFDLVVLTSFMIGIKLGWPIYIHSPLFMTRYAFGNLSLVVVVLDC